LGKPFSQVILTERKKSGIFSREKAQEPQKETRAGRVVTLKIRPPAVQKFTEGNETKRGWETFRWTGRKARVFCREKAQESQKMSRKGG